jgi:catalase
MANTVKNTIKTRQVALLVTDGVNEKSLNKIKKALEDADATAKVIAPHLGFITGAKGALVKVDQRFLTAASVLFDAVYVPDGQQSTDNLQQESDAVDFINEAYKHCKAVAADCSGVEFVSKTNVFNKKNIADNKIQSKATVGVLMNQTPKDFCH